MSKPYEDIGAEVGRLVADKQHQYGNSFIDAGRIMRILYPAGIPLSAIDQALTMVRVIDKLKRVATARGGADPGGESPWRDIAGYSILELSRDLEDDR